MNKLLTFIKKISYAILPMVLFVGSLLLSWYLNQVITNGTQPGDWHYGTTWPKLHLMTKSLSCLHLFTYITLHSQLGFSPFSIWHTKTKQNFTTSF